jgi:molybdopterin-guanine dinucleotide biosynthesis protein A
VTTPAEPTAIGIVLAGGASSRMQATPVASGERVDVPAVRKEWLEIGGRTLLARVVAAVAAGTSRTIVVTAPGRPLPPLAHAVEVVHDTAPNAGPLAALVDGLRAIGSTPAEPVVFVASCDLPLLDAAVVRLLVERAAASGADWIVPVIDEHPQVLASVVRRTLIGPITAWLESGRRDPRGLLAALGGTGQPAVQVGANELRIRAAIGFEPAITLDRTIADIAAECARHPEAIA